VSGIFLLSVCAHVMNGELVLVVVDFCFHFEPH
jgi:hypothetical protein